MSFRNTESSRFRDEVRGNFRNVTLGELLLWLRDVCGKIAVRENKTRASIYRNFMHTIPPIIIIYSEPSFKLRVSKFRDVTQVAVALAYKENDDELYIVLSYVASEWRRVRSRRYFIHVQVADATVRTLGCHELVDTVCLSALRLQLFQHGVVMCSLPPRGIALGNQ